DVRSDIFFLGCVLYELLTGRSPLEMTRDKHARMNPRRFVDVQPMRREEVDAPPTVFQLVETMMSLSPERRYQTPSQLLDTIRNIRRDLQSGATGTRQGTGGVQSIYVVETDERLKEKIRSKFKELGFRVLIANDPLRALDRFRQQPYQGLIIDARTTGEDGLMTFDRIMAESERVGQPLAGVLLLADEQAGWAHRVHPRPSAVILIDSEKRPITLKHLHRKLLGMLGIDEEGQ